MEENKNLSKTIQNRKFTHQLAPSEWGLIIAFGLIFLTGVVGNAFVIYVFGYKRKSRYRLTSEWLILYLGVVDFLSSILNPPLYIYWTYTHYKDWHFGDIGCKIIPALGPIMSSVSSGLLIIFAIDRYLAVVSLLKGSSLSWKTVTIAFFMDIILSICFYLYHISALKLSPNSDKHGFSCYVPTVKTYYYSIPSCVLLIFRFLFFAVVFTFTTVKITQVLRRGHVSLLSKELQQRRLQNSKKTLNVLLTMGVVFFLLVFPKEILQLVYSLSWMIKETGIIHTSQLVEVNSWLKVIHTANSCANVFIYSQMHRVYRRQMSRFLCPFGACKKVYIRYYFNK